MPRPINTPYDLAAQVGRLREASGLTQAEVAARAGVSRKYVARLEKLGAPHEEISRLLAVLAALGGAVEIVDAPAAAPDGGPAAAVVAEIRRYL